MKIALYYSTEYNLLKCKKNCKAVATRKESVLWNGPHYHCFGCGNLFKKNRALSHYHLHTGNAGQASHSNNQSVASSNTISNTTQHSTSHTQNDEPTSPPPLDDSPLQDSATITTTIHNIAPSAIPFTRTPTDRVPCKYCSRLFHPHSLKVSIYIKPNINRVF